MAAFFLTMNINGPESVADRESSNVSEVLQQLRDGDSSTADQLLRILYKDLRRLAAIRLADERTDHSLQPTDLVHEVYLRLVDEGKMPAWNDRRHFFSAATEAMRRILVDHARSKKCQKRGGDHQRVEFHDQLIPDERTADRLIAVDEALQNLEETDPQKAELVKLRFMGGLTIDQAAKALGISHATAERHWAFARAQLKLSLGDDTDV